jgi:hypothetical protein
MNAQRGHEASGAAPHSTDPPHEIAHEQRDVADVADVAAMPAERNADAIVAEFMSVFPGTVEISEHEWAAA